MQAHRNHAEGRPPGHHGGRAQASSRAGRREGSPAPSLPRGIFSCPAAPLATLLLFLFFILNTVIKFYWKRSKEHICRDWIYRRGRRRTQNRAGPGRAARGRRLRERRPRARRAWARSATCRHGLGRHGPAAAPEGSPGPGPARLRVAPAPAVPSRENRGRRTLSPVDADRSNHAPISFGYFRLLAFWWWWFSFHSAVPMIPAYFYSLMPPLSSDPQPRNSSLPGRQLWTRT